MTHTVCDEERALLEAVGVRSVEDLYVTVPPALRGPVSLDFGPGFEENAGLSEREIRNRFSKLASTEDPRLRQSLRFLGAGDYEGMAGALTEHIGSRDEWVGAGPPLALSAQGTLEAIGELERAVGSVLEAQAASVTFTDGAWAAAEAVRLAVTHVSAHQAQVLLSDGLSPAFRDVLRWHAPSVGQIPLSHDGHTDLSHLKKTLEEGPPAALVVASPNRYGIVEPLAWLREVLPKESLLIVCTEDFAAFSVYETPHQQGADLSAVELSSLIGPPALGGLRLGALAGPEFHVARSTGWRIRRISGTAHPLQTKGSLTSSPWGGGVLAVRALATLWSLGTEGFAALGEKSHATFQYLATELASVGIPLRFPRAPHYREGLFCVPNLTHRLTRCREQGIVAGVPVTQNAWDDPLLLVCCTSEHSLSDIDCLVEALSHD